MASSPPILFDLVAVLRTTLDTPFCIYTRAGVVEYASSESLTLFEMEREEQEKLNFFQHFQHSESKQIWQAVLSGNTVCYAIQDFAGHCRLSLLPDSRYILLQFRGLEHSSNQQQQIGALFKQSNYGIATATFEGEISQANTAFYRIFSIPLDHLIQLYQVIYSEDLAIELENRLKLRHKELSSYQIDCRAWKKHRLIWVRLTMSRMDSKSLLLIVEEVQSEYEQQERLLRLERDWRSLTINQTTMLIQLNLEGQIAFVSRAFEQKLGYPGSEICGTFISQWVHPQDH